jgi:MFS transporter, ACS family, tartrate transporter
VNVGFAALTMNQDLGLSQTAFGFGAGFFFIAYFIFEVPSNLLLERWERANGLRALCWAGESCPV